MTTLKRISNLTGYSEAYLTSKDYKGNIKNIRLAAIWIMREEFDVDELAIIFNRQPQNIRYMLHTAQGLLEAHDSCITRLIEQLYQPSKTGFKKALKRAVESWDKSTTFNQWIFKKGMEYQSNKINKKL